MSSISIRTGVASAAAASSARTRSQAISGTLQQIGRNLTICRFDYQNSRVPIAETTRRLHTIQASLITTQELMAEPSRPDASTARQITLLQLNYERLALRVDCAARSSTTNSGWAANLNGRIGDQQNIVEILSFLHPDDQINAIRANTVRGGAQPTITLQMRLRAVRDQMRTNRGVTVENLRAEARLVAAINTDIETRNERTRRDNLLRIQRSQAPLALQPLEGYPIMDEIEEVDLSGTSPIYRGSMLLRELERFPCRRTLSLHRSITDDDLNAVAFHEERRQAAHLAPLLAYCQMSGDPVVYDLAARCQRDPVGAKGALLDYCGRSSDRTLQTLAERYRSLRSLNLTNCRSISDSGIERFLYACPDLQSLNINSCWPLTDAGIHAIAVNCRDLQSLNVSLCIGLTDASIRTIAANCGDLQSLNVSHCSQLTDASIQMVATSCRNLRSLDVEYCAQFTDASIRAIAVNCHGLQSLNVSHCPQLTDASICAVAANCRGLQSLNVNSCRQLTDTSIGAVATNCRGLQGLDAFNCKQLTDVSIRAIDINCHGLQRLNVMGCLRLTDAGVSAIQIGHPHLIVVAP